jgi:hypothetical protein
MSSSVPIPSTDETKRGQIVIAIPSRDFSSDDQMIINLARNRGALDMSSKIVDDIGSLEKRLIKARPKARAYLLAKEVPGIKKRLDDAKVAHPDLAPHWDDMSENLDTLMRMFRVDSKRG